MINGCSNHGSIAEAFSKLYAKQCLPNNESTHAKLQHEFHSIGLCRTYIIGSAFDAQTAVNVELVISVIRGSSTERLLALAVFLRNICCIAIHCYVYCCLFSFA